MRHSMNIHQSSVALINCGCVKFSFQFTWLQSSNLKNSLFSHTNNQEIKPNFHLKFIKKIILTVLEA